MRSRLFVKQSVAGAVEYGEGSPAGSARSAPTGLRARRWHPAARQGSTRDADWLSPLPADPLASQCEKIRARPDSSTSDAEGAT